ncbi:hypothetical protein LSCM1_07475 [Leishmania martiniquensis]|uniref:Tyrosine phospatase-like protein n=1 Tax=Leishmania martiniquensis TaxID=1580590 RepID=A0A836HTV4_9TRYP|nr:hypothetical protein LSCM1_07475 [Leishmania martiniquensis]
MSSPPLQPHPMWTLRAHNTHDAAAALFEEMSHAARTGGCAGALPTALSTAAPLSHVQHPRGSGYGSAAAGDSSSQPPCSTGLSPAAPAITTVSLPSVGNSVPPLALPATVQAPHEEDPYFYVRPFSSGQAAVGSHHSGGSCDPLAAHAAAHSRGVPASSSTCSSPPLRSSSLTGLGSVANAGAPLDVESGTGHNSPGALSPTLQSLALPTGLSGGAGSVGPPGSHLTTPSNTRGTPTAAVGPVATPVYVWHNATSVAGAAPWLRLHRPAVVGATPTRPLGVTGAGAGGRRGYVAATGGGAGGVGAPLSPGGSGVGMLASPQQPSNPLVSHEHAHTKTASGVADEDVAQRHSGRGPTGRNSCGGAPVATGGLSRPHPQQSLLANDLCSGGALHGSGAVLPFTLVPPLRFARVESGVYRGAYPVLRNFPHIRRLRLRTIVSLIPEPPTFDLQCFAEAEHIQLHHIHAERAKGEVQLLPSELSEALQLILNKDMHPLYVHCLDGRHVTGLVVMALRKLLQWDAKAAHAEYQRFTREVQDEVAFIADYTGPLLVPPHLPAWLWGGSLYDAATGQQKRLPTSMRLRFSTAVSGGAGGGAPLAAGAGPANSPLGSMSAAVSHNAKGAMRDAGGDLRPQAAAPWMRVPQAEVVAEDGQHYIDVDSLPVAQAPLGNLPGAARPNCVSPMKPSVPNSSGPASVSEGRAGAGNRGLNPIRSEVPFGYCTTENNSLAGPATVVAASGTGSVGGGTRWRSTASGDALEPHPGRLTPSLANSDAASRKNRGANGLLDGRLSALLWTSGLVAPSAAVGGNSSSPGGGRVSGGSAVGSGGGGTSGSCGAAVGVSGQATVLASSSAGTTKRSYSR